MFVLQHFLMDRSKGTKCKSPGYTDCYVGEIVLNGQATQFLCGLESEKKAPTQRQVNHESRQRGVDLVYDPEAVCLNRLCRVQCVSYSELHGARRAESNRTCEDMLMRTDF